MATSSSRRRRDERATGAERITLVISVLLFATLVGSLVYLRQVRGSSPPVIAVAPHWEQAREDGGDWYLPVTVSNTGDRATDLLRVDLVRPIPGEQPEVAELSWTFVAGGEQVEGIAVFDEEPTEETVEVDILSVTEP